MARELVVLDQLSFVGRLTKKGGKHMVGETHIVEFVRYAHSGIENYSLNCFFKTIRLFQVLDINYSGTFIFKDKVIIVVRNLSQADYFPVIGYSCHPIRDLLDDCLLSYEQFDSLPVPFSAN